MIQRVQSIYLLIATFVSFGLIFVFKLWSINENKFFVFDLFNEDSFLLKGITLLFLLSAILTFTAIFSEPMVSAPTFTISATDIGGYYVVSATMTEITSLTFDDFARSGVASYVTTDSSSMTFWTYQVNGQTLNYSTAFTENSVWVYTLDMDNWSGPASGTFTAKVSATDFGGYSISSTDSYTFFENIALVFTGLKVSNNSDLYKDAKNKVLYLRNLIFLQILTKF